MAGLMGFPAHGFRSNRSYSDSYSSDSDHSRRHTRDQRRMVAEYQRQAYMQRLHSQQSSPGGMGGFQPPFSNRSRPSPLMGGHPQFGFPSSLGMNMSGGGLGGMGGMGYGMGMGSATGLGMGPGMGPGMGRGGGIGCSNRLPFLSDLRVGYGQSSPFGLGQSYRSHPMSASRHRQNDQPSWPQARRTSFSTSLFDNDEDDESDYDASATCSHPRRRRGGFGQLGQSPHGTRHRPSWLHSHNDCYEEYDNEDAEDDESDFEEYYQVRRRRPRY